MNTSFCNITDIPRYNGLQIKLNVMQVKPYQIYFGVICKESLKKCISKRNDLYRKHSVLPKGILLKKLTGPVKSKTSSSGYHGIYDHIYLEKTGDEIAVFSVSLRNLVTGKATNRSIRKHHFSSDIAAKKRARELRRTNINHYNSIIDVYNDMLFNDCIKIADQEMKDLKPRLHLFIKFDRARWNMARDTIFPNGFINNIEPVLFN